MTEIHAERWSVAWDEVEDFDDAMPLRPTRRTSPQEWGVAGDWDDVVVGPALSVEVDASLVRRDALCSCGHRLSMHYLDGCQQRVAYFTNRYEESRYGRRPPRRCSCPLDEPETVVVDAHVARQLIPEGDPNPWSSLRTRRR